MQGKNRKVFLGIEKKKTKQKFFSSRLNKFQNLIGSEGAFWLGASLGVSEDEAKRAGQGLMASGYLACVNGQLTFSEKEFYYFQSAEDWNKNRNP